MIYLENVTKRYGDNLILKDWSLEIRAGEAVAVTGESGCGKTTLLRILAGLDSDYQGHVFLAGQPADRLPPCGRNLAMAFQEPVLWNHMTVEKNILFPLGRPDKKARLLAEQICGELEIGGLMRRYPGEISGGQARRVSLARALLSGKGILLLDEPLSNVDEKTRERILDFLRREYVGKRTILYVSHDRDEVDFLCSRTVAL